MIPSQSPARASTKEEFRYEFQVNPQILLLDAGGWVGIGAHAQRSFGIVYGSAAACVLVETAGSDRVKGEATFEWSGSPSDRLQHNFEALLLAIAGNSTLSFRARCYALPRRQASDQIDSFLTSLKPEEAILFLPDMHMGLSDKADDFLGDMGDSENFDALMLLLKGTRQAGVREIIQVGDMLDIWETEEKILSEEHPVVHLAIAAAIPFLHELSKAWASHGYKISEHKPGKAAAISAGGFVASVLAELAILLELQETLPEDLPQKAELRVRQANAAMLTEIGKYVKVFLRGNHDWKGGEVRAWCDGTTFHEKSGNMPANPKILATHGDFWDEFFNKPDKLSLLYKADPRGGVNGRCIGRVVTWICAYMERHMDSDFEYNIYWDIILPGIPHPKNSGSIPKRKFDSDQGSKSQRKKFRRYWRGFVKPLAPPLRWQKISEIPRIVVIGHTHHPYIDLYPLIDAKSSLQTDSIVQSLSET